MALVIEAPFPGPVTAHYLPNPLSGDSIGNTGTLEFKRAMNGKRYAYIKSRDNRKRLIWTFRLSQDKALEMQAFFAKFSGSKVKVTDHFGKIYVGNFTTNPFEFETVGRSVASPSNNSLHQIQIEFEGIEQV